MTYERALELLKIERECIKRADACNRNCAKCDLVQDPNELLEMYDWVISNLSPENPLINFDLYAIFAQWKWAIPD